MKVLAISGSLRKSSLNSALLQAFVQLAPPEFQVSICTVVGKLPLFNPDLEANLPQVVRLLHQQVAAADVLLIASPEYAHGVTGAIKNTLDWLVSFEAFVAKPVAVLNASPRAHHADSALRETLRTMSAVIIEPASVTFPLVGSGIPAEKLAEQDFIQQAVVNCLTTLNDEVVLRSVRSR
jgi:chromate reductase, NAD(P)H dehydrogenase (quinone)